MVPWHLTEKDLVLTILKNCEGNVKELMLGFDNSGRSSGCYARSLKVPY